MSLVGAAFEGRHISKGAHLNNDLKLLSESFDQSFENGRNLTRIGKPHNDVIIKGILKGGNKSNRRHDDEESASLFIASRRKGNHSIKQVTINGDAHILSKDGDDDVSSHGPLAHLRNRITTTATHTTDFTVAPTIATAAINSPTNQSPQKLRDIIIPPPSRKYTVTKPGTLSPIYHLIYDLTSSNSPTSTKTPLSPPLPPPPHQPQSTPSSQTTASSPKSRDFDSLEPSRYDLNPDNRNARHHSNNDHNNQINHDHPEPLSPPFPSSPTSSSSITLSSYHHSHANHAVTSSAFHRIPYTPSSSSSIESSANTNGCTIPTSTTTTTPSFHANPLTPHFQQQRNKTNCATSPVPSNRSNKPVSQSSHQLSRDGHVASCAFTTGTQSTDGPSLPTTPHNHCIPSQSLPPPPPPSRDHPPPFKPRRLPHSLHSSIPPHSNLRSITENDNRHDPSRQKRHGNLEWANRREDAPNITNDNGVGCDNVFSKPSPSLVGKDVTTKTGLPVRHGSPPLLSSDSNKNISFRTLTNQHNDYVIPSSNNPQSKVGKSGNHFCDSINNVPRDIGLVHGNNQNKIPENSLDDREDRLSHMNIFTKTNEEDGSLNSKGSVIHSDSNGFKLNCDVPILIGRANITDSFDYSSSRGNELDTAAVSCSCAIFTSGSRSVNNAYCATNSVNIDLEIANNSCSVNSADSAYDNSEIIKPDERTGAGVGGVQGKPSDQPEIEGRKSGIPSHLSENEISNDSKRAVFKRDGDSVRLFFVKNHVDTHCTTNSVRERLRLPNSVADNAAIENKGDNASTFVCQNDNQISQKSSRKLSDTRSNSNNIPNSKKDKSKKLSLKKKDRQQSFKNANNDRDKNSGQTLSSPGSISGGNKKSPVNRWENIDVPVGLYSRQLLTSSSSEPDKQTSTFILSEQRGKRAHGIKGERECGNDKVERTIIPSSAQTVASPVLGQNASLLTEASTFHTVSNCSPESSTDHRAVSAHCDAPAPLTSTRPAIRGILVNKRDDPLATGLSKQKGALQKQNVVHFLDDTRIPSPFVFHSPPTQHSSNSKALPATQQRDANGHYKSSLLSSPNTIRRDIIDRNKYMIKHGSSSYVSTLLNRSVDDVLQSASSTITELSNDKPQININKSTSTPNTPPGHNLTADIRIKPNARQGTYRSNDYPSITNGGHHVPELSCSGFQSDQINSYNPTVTTPALNYITGTPSISTSPVAATITPAVGSTGGELVDCSANSASNGNFIPMQSPHRGLQQNVSSAGGLANTQLSNNCRKSGGHKTIKHCTMDSFDNNKTRHNSCPRPRGIQNEQTESLNLCHRWVFPNQDSYRLDTITGLGLSDFDCVQSKKGQGPARLPKADDELETLNSADKDNYHDNGFLSKQSGPSKEGATEHSVTGPSTDSIKPGGPGNNVYVGETCKEINNQIWIENLDTLKYAEELKQAVQKSSLRHLFGSDHNSNNCMEDYSITTSSKFDTTSHSGFVSETNRDITYDKKTQNFIATQNVKPRDNKQPPKITPRQKFEILHHPLSHKVATSLRPLNHTAMEEEGQAMSPDNLHVTCFNGHNMGSISNSATGALLTANNSQNGFLYKESPRAKFERDRAARSNAISGASNDGTQTHFNPNQDGQQCDLNHPKTTMKTHSGRSPLPSKKFNRSCDDLDTNTFGHSKPSPNNKSQLSETGAIPYLDTQYSIPSTPPRPKPRSSLLQYKHIAQKSGHPNDISAKHNTFESSNNNQFNIIDVRDHTDNFDYNQNAHNTFIDDNTKLCLGNAFAHTTTKRADSGYAANNVNALKLPPRSKPRLEYHRCNNENDIPSFTTLHTNKIRPKEIEGRDQNKRNTDRISSDFSPRSVVRPLQSGVVSTGVGFHIDLGERGGESTISRINKSYSSGGVGANEQSTPPTFTPPSPIPQTLALSLSRPIDIPPSHSSVQSCVDEINTGSHFVKPSCRGHSGVNDSEQKQGPCSGSCNFCDRTGSDKCPREYSDSVCKDWSAGDCHAAVIRDNKSDIDNSVGFIYSAPPRGICDGDDSITIRNININGDIRQNSPFVDSKQFEQFQNQKSCLEVPTLLKPVTTKKLSPDSISSSGYESEHAASCGKISYKNVKSKQHFHSLNNNCTVQDTNSSSKRSTVKELRLRFGHDTHERNSNISTQKWVELESKGTKSLQNESPSIPTNEDFNRLTNNTVHCSYEHFNNSTSNSVNKHASSSINNSKRNYVDYTVDKNINGIHNRCNNDTNYNNNNRLSNSIASSSQSSPWNSLDRSRDANSFSCSKPNTVSRIHFSPKDKNDIPLTKVGYCGTNIFHDNPHPNVPSKNYNLCGGDNCDLKGHENSNSNERVSQLQDLSYSSNLTNLHKNPVSLINGCQNGNLAIVPCRQEAGSDTININTNSTQSRFLGYNSTFSERLLTHDTAMLASKGLRIYEDSNDYLLPVEQRNSSNAASLASIEPKVSWEAASYLIVPTVVESFNHLDIQNSPYPNGHDSQSHSVLDILTQRSISDSGTQDLQLQLRNALPLQDDVNTGAHSDGDVCSDNEYIAMTRSPSSTMRARAMSVDLICKDVNTNETSNCTSKEVILNPNVAKVSTRIKRKDRRPSRGYVEWKTCSGWLGSVDMKNYAKRNSRGYVEWDTIWSPAPSSKGDGNDDEHVYDVIIDEQSLSSPKRLEEKTNNNVTSSTTNDNDVPPALPERTYINRLKQPEEPVRVKHSPHCHKYHHNRNNDHTPHQHHHHNHRHRNNHQHHSKHHHHSNGSPSGHHHHNHSSHSNQSNQSSHNHSRRHHHHHHRQHCDILPEEHQNAPSSSSSHAQSSSSIPHKHNKSSNKSHISERHLPPPPPPPHSPPSPPPLPPPSPPPLPPPNPPPAHLTQPSSPNYAKVHKLKGYMFGNLSSSVEESTHTSNVKIKSAIYSENYCHLQTLTSHDRMTLWKPGDVLNYIDGLHESMSPKSRENIYILLNNKKTRAKFSESLEIESRLLSRGLLGTCLSKMDIDASQSGFGVPDSDRKTPVAKKRNRVPVSSTYV